MISTRWLEDVDVSKGGGLHAAALVVTVAVIGVLTTVAVTVGAILANWMWWCVEMALVWVIVAGIVRRIV